MRSWPAATARIRGMAKGTAASSTARLASWPSAILPGRSRPSEPLPRTEPFSPTLALNCCSSSRSKSNSTIASTSCKRWPMNCSWPPRRRRKPLAMGSATLPRTSSCRSPLPSFHSRAGWASPVRKRRPSSRLASLSSTPSWLGSRGTVPARSTLLAAPAARSERSTSSRPCWSSIRPRSKSRGVFCSLASSRARLRLSSGLEPPRL